MATLRVIPFVQQENGGERCVTLAAVLQHISVLRFQLKQRKLTIARATPFPYFSVWSNWERAMLVQEPQAVSVSQWWLDVTLHALQFHN